MTDFAKTQLMKYGWREGKGLGKNGSGITEALKPKLKFDTTGIGHKDEHWNKWWETGFNKAANNIVVDSRTHGVSISVAKKSTTNESSKKDLNENKFNCSMNYRNFLKTSTLHNGNLIEEDTSHAFEVENIEKVVMHIPLTDEELFKVCGSRTAHKGARHGLTLNGKLQRVAQQEKDLLGMNFNINMSDTLHNGEFERDKFAIDNNKNTISPNTIFPSEKVSISKVSKSTKRKNKRQIIDLNHQLNILCNISDNDEKTKNIITDDAVVKKISKLKYIRMQKRGSTSHDADSIKREKEDKKIDDTLFPVSQKLNSEIIMNKTQEHISNHDIKEFDDSMHKKKMKRSKKKKKKNQDHKDGNMINTWTDEKLHGSRAKKLKKSRKRDSSIHYLSKDEDINMLEPKFQSELLPFSCVELSDTHFKKEADRLNARISKKKKAKLDKKQRIKVAKITESLQAVYFSAEESIKTSDTKNKFNTLVEKTVESNIAKDKTKSLKTVTKKKDHT